MVGQLFESFSQRQQKKSSSSKETPINRTLFPTYTHKSEENLYRLLPYRQKNMTSSLEQLKATGTTVVCDSGDFETIGKYKAQDATTNPSLILAASKKAEYAKLMDVAVEYGKDHVGSAESDRQTTKLIVAGQRH